MSALRNGRAIHRAGFIGFDNGTTTCPVIAIHHSEIVINILTFTVTKRDGMQLRFSDQMESASPNNRPFPQQAARPKPSRTQRGLKHCFRRM
jgi:hypothetical protein